MREDLVTEGIHGGDVAMGLFKFFGVTGGFVMTVAGFVSSAPILKALVGKKFYELDLPILGLFNFICAEGEGVLESCPTVG